MDAPLVFCGMLLLGVATLLMLAYLYVEQGSILDPIPASWVGFITFVSIGQLTVGFFNAERTTQAEGGFGIVLVILATVGYIAGLYAGSGRWLSRLIPVPSATLESGQVLLMWIISAVLMVVLVFMNLVLPDAVAKIAQGVASGALGALILLSLYCLFGPFKGTLLKLLMLPTLGFCVWFVFTFFWSRRPMMGIAIAAGAYIYRAKLAHRSIAARVLSFAVFGVSVLILTQYLTVTRGSRMYGVQAGSMFTADGLRNLLGGIEINYNVYEFALAEFPRNEDFLWGSGFGPAFLFMIPRSVWPDKPNSSGGIITAMYFNTDYSKTNLSPSFIGECYMNFGILGVPILAFIAGRVVRSLNTYTREQNHNPIVWLSWLLILPDFASEWRGDFTSMTVQPFLRVAVFVGLAWVVAKLRGQGSSVQAPVLPGPMIRGQYHRPTQFPGRY